VAAELKSHVLRRDEKGFMGIPFKRLLLAAARAPQGALARLRDAIGLPADLVTLVGEQLFRPPVVSTATLAAIARHIREICWEWRWA
jgi:hypothetical protein